MFIHSYIRILGEHLNINNVAYNVPANSLDLFKHLVSMCANTSPKWYKMDKASAIINVSAALLLNETKTDQVDSYDKGIVLYNSLSSYIGDIAFEATRLDQNPSPSCFVYTLPNIAIGEICIRHHFKGYNHFIICNSFDEANICEDILYLSEKQQLTLCIGGWADVLDNKTDLLLILINNTKSEQPLTQENLINLYYGHA